MKREITKQIIRDVEQSLAEIDIDGMVEKAVNSKEVNKIVERYVKDKIGQIIQDKAYIKIHKQMPIIDAWTESKVQAFLYELGVKP